MGIRHKYFPEEKIHMDNKFTEFSISLVIKEYKSEPWLRYHSSGKNKEFQQ